MCKSLIGTRQVTWLGGWGNVKKNTQKKALFSPAPRGGAQSLLSFLVWSRFQSIPFITSKKQKKTPFVDKHKNHLSGSCFWFSGTAFVLGRVYSLEFNQPGKRKKHGFWLPGYTNIVWFEGWFLLNYLLSCGQDFSTRKKLDFLLKLYPAGWDYHSFRIPCCWNSFGLFIQCWNPGAFCKLAFSRWWFQIFFIITPTIWGRWTHFDEHIFQRGWFNHLVFWPQHFWSPSWTTVNQSWEMGWWKKW